MYPTAASIRPGSRSSSASTQNKDGEGVNNLTEHILSRPPQNVFLDPSATNASQFFYRIKVE